MLKPEKVLALLLCQVDQHGYGGGGCLPVEEALNPCSEAGEGEGLGVESTGGLRTPSRFHPPPPIRRPLQK